MAFPNWIGKKALASGGADDLLEQMQKTEAQFACIEKQIAIASQQLLKAREELRDFESPFAGASEGLRSAMQALRECASQVSATTRAKAKL